MIETYSKTARKYLTTFGNLRKSSDIFGHFRKMIRNVRMNFGQSSESLRKSLYSTRYLTRSLRSLVRYRVEHSKIKFVSTRGHVISSI